MPGGPREAELSKTPDGRARASGRTARALAFELRGRESVRALRRVLGGGLRLERPRSEARICTHLDTFEWSLHRRGLRLPATTGDEETWLELSRAAGGPTLERLQLSKLPAFALDLPDGALRERLSAIVRRRRLIPVVTLEERRELQSVTDDERKTVVRLAWARTRATDPEAPASARSLPVVLEVRAVRGFPEPWKRVIGILRKRGLPEVARDPLDRALAALGRRPETYSAGLDVELDPAAPVGRATLTLLRRLLEIQRANEEGIRRDLDPEHLHDFRVAIRRTRLLLRLVRKLLDEPSLRALRRGFVAVGRATGPTRDLDVHLEELVAECEEMPESEQRALAPALALLRDRRETAFAELLDDLNSPERAALMQSAEQLVHLDGDLAGRGPAVGAWSAHRIWRAYRKLRDRGRSIGRDAPPEALHELRMDAKRLRYLIEFFRGLYPADEVADALRELKRFQNLLGAFNDARNQEQILREIGADLTRSGRANPETLIAIGRLVDRLETRRERMRQRFAQRFRVFDAPENRARFRGLFRDRVTEGTR
jgi:CHAD domain-containing protein